MKELTSNNILIVLFQKLINKGIAKGIIGIIKNLRYSLPRKSLITMYKAFLRPLIDYGDIIYDQHQYESFRKKLESIHYEAALAITGVIQGFSCQNFIKN